jgi:hypothetical protein
VTYDAHRKLALSALAHRTLGIIPLVAGVVTMLHTSTKNSVRKLIDYATYVFKLIRLILKLMLFSKSYLIICKGFHGWDGVGSVVHLYCT